MYAYTCIYTHIHASTYTHVHMHIHKHLHTLTDSHAHTSAHTKSHTHAHTVRIWEINTLRKWPESGHECSTHLSQLSITWVFQSKHPWLNVAQVDLSLPLYVSLWILLFQHFLFSCFTKAGKQEGGRWGGRKSKQGEGWAGQEEDASS